jgi:uncharacterized metal-binding protein
MNAKLQLPLVYSCSGCSSAAQMANHLALRLDRAGAAEMSCIAGVGGDVPHLLKIAKSGRPIVALDGCPLDCAKNCLARHGIGIDLHYVLSDHGVRKRYRADFDAGEAEGILQRILPGVRRLNRFQVLPALLADKDRAAVPTRP